MFWILPQLMALKARGSSSDCKNHRKQALTVQNHRKQALTVQNHRKQALTVQNHRKQALTVQNHRKQPLTVQNSPYGKLTNEGWCVSCEFMWNLRKINRSVNFKIKVD